GTGASLHSVNVGDSGFLLFRPSYSGAYGTFGGVEIKLIHRSPRQRIGSYPPQLNSLGSATVELSKHSLVEYKVFPNDIIVMGTDGLFDNLFDKEIENIIRLQLLHFPHSPYMVQHVAQY